MEWRKGQKAIYEIVSHHTSYRKDIRHITEVPAEILEVHEKSCKVRVSNGTKTAVITALKTKLKPVEASNA